MTQLAIDLPYRAAFGEADFLASASNGEALGWIERWPDWPAPALVIHGPPGSGKTHLAHLWCGRCGGTILGGGLLAAIEPVLAAADPARGIAVDEADRAAEQPLLHLYNWCVERGTSLLLLSRSAPAAWPLRLPDLASRLRSLPAAGIGAPDDRLLAAVLVKHFADRGMRVSPGVIGYLVRRMERSFAAATDVAAALDQAALSRRGAVTVRLARAVLGYSSMPSDFGVT